MTSRVRLLRSSSDSQASTFNLPTPFFPLVSPTNFTLYHHHHPQSLYMLSALRRKPLIFTRSSSTRLTVVRLPLTQQHHLSHPHTSFAMAPKRAASTQSIDVTDSKKKRVAGASGYVKKSAKSGGEDGWTPGDMNPTGKLHEDPTPRDQLSAALQEQGKRKDAKGNVVYWMRMRDLRVEDNHALSIASHLAKENKAHLIALHVLSPGDYAAHDRSPRRIDFVLRNMEVLKKQLDKLNIPLHVVTQDKDKRKEVPDRVLELCKELGASDLVGNIEHEVDELWRDIAVLKGAKKVDVHAQFVEDTYVVPPGAVKTNEGKPYR